MEDPTLSGRKRPKSRLGPAIHRDAEDITGPIRKIRRRAHLRAELTVAYLRVLVLVGLLVVRALQFAFPAVSGTTYLPPSIVYLPIAYLAVAIGIAAILRRGWCPVWLGPGLTLLDGVCIAVVNLQSTALLGPQAYLTETATLSLLCALFAASGGFNVTRWEALWTGLVALGVFATATMWFPGRRLSPGALALNLILLGCAGVLGTWSTSQIRRALRGKLGQATLARFLPRKLLDDAYHDPLSLLDEPRAFEATVLVTDIRGFTKLAETMSPPRVLAVLNEIQGALAQVIYEHGGVVDKFMGDGMLAVFGAPEARADHAECGLRAAAALRPALAEVNGRLISWGLAPVRIGIGLHSGSLVAGCLGAGPRLEFTIIGDTVNTASRLEAMTKDLEVDALISAATLEGAGKAADEIAVRPMGRLSLRGRVEPLMVFTFGATVEATRPLSTDLPV